MSELDRMRQRLEEMGLAVKGAALLHQRNLDLTTERDAALAQVARVEAEIDRWHGVVPIPELRAALADTTCCGSLDCACAGNPRCEPTQAFPQDDPHPESYCHRCSGPNFPWWVPSPIWNAVIGYGPQSFDGIVCPKCFAELAEAKGAKGPWRVAPRVWPDVSLVHVDGRVWDEATELWADPPQDDHPSPADLTPPAPLEAP